MDVRSAVAAAARRFAAASTPVLDFLYPPVCLTCPARVDAPGTPVCPGCAAALAAIEADHPSWRSMEEHLRAGGAADGFLTCFLFEKEGTLQELLHLMKYRGFRRAALWLGGLLGARIREHPDFRAADVIVPVPLHRRRRRERGYNQAALIAEGASAAASIRVDGGALVRLRDTPSQTDLSLGERRTNVAGAFAAARTARLEGRRVILLDDLVTTGATVAAAAAALRAADAARVFCASVAVAR